VDPFGDGVSIVGSGAVDAAEELPAADDLGLPE
jgi:hypothetical protein